MDGATSPPDGSLIVAEATVVETLSAAAIAVIIILVVVVVALVIGIIVYRVVKRAPKLTQPQFSKVVFNPDLLDTIQQQRWSVCLTAVPSL